MTKIRILQVLPHLKRGGSQAMVMNLYRSINREIIQFDFIVFTKDYADYYEEIREMGGKIFHFKKINTTNYFAVKKEWNDFFKNHPEYKILHSHVRSFASVYIPIAKKYNLTTIIHSHSTSQGPGIIKGIIKSFLEYPLRFQADYLFACSTEAGQWLYGKKALSQQNYSFIPNAIPVCNFLFSKDERNRIRKEYGINDEIVIGHVGVFRTAKNHFFLIKCFRSFLEIHPDAKLMLVGSGDLDDKVRAICKEYNISDHVIFTGLQTDVRPYLSAMDFFLFPSIWEGLPVSVVEAQACGLRCLLSDVITRDVALTDLVKYYPLSQGANNWAKEINKMIPPERQAATNVVLDKLSCFDSAHTIKDLESFYLNCYNRKTTEAFV